ncbi:MAG: hypothetical protein IIA90_06820 [Chloroflexi bacterium]|nr:hypothetical protein [Chloroflexota bacterium]
MERSEAKVDARAPGHSEIAARESYEALGREDQRALDRIIRNLCDEPYIDAPLKIAFPVPPAVIILYNDLEYWVAYHLPDNLTVEVWNVGKAPADPDIRNR